MKYILLTREKFVAVQGPYSTALESDDIVEIKEKIKKMVAEGYPVDHLRIVQDIPFEFKCAIRISEGEENVPS